MTTTITRRRLLTLAGAGAAGLAAPRLAMAREPEVFVDYGVAIRGADPIAYFVEGAAVEGRQAHRHVWKGATWQFVSAANRDRFAAAPERYAPQFGGWCAWALSRGGLAPTDPSAWVIHEGRLYLNYNRGTQRRFERDLSGNIARAEANWPSALG